MKNQSDRWVYIVDDDASTRNSLGSLLRSIGLQVAAFETTDAFLAADRPEVPSCLVLDIRLKGENGLTFQRRAQTWNVDLPIVFVTGHADVPMTVSAMKAGAVDFLTKPFREQDMLDSVDNALQVDAQRLEHLAANRDIRDRYQKLTEREKQIVPYVIAGLLNKQIADRLQLSEVTVKIHRGAAMRKLGVKSVADLVRHAQVLKIAPNKL
jgi:FixJ family two-component response regulator